MNYLKPNIADPSQSSIEPQPIRPYDSALRKRLLDIANIDETGFRGRNRSRGTKANVVGLRYGRLVIQRVVGTRTTDKRAIALCHCDCGTAILRLLDAVQGSLKSCGCLNEELRPMLKKQRILTELIRDHVLKERASEASRRLKLRGPYGMPDNPDINYNNGEAESAGSAEFSVQQNEPNDVD